MPRPDVQTFHANPRAHDSPRIAHARVQLKLAALAYSQSRHGADGGPSMARSGTAMLCQAAINYAETLTGQKIPIDPTLHLDDGM